MLPYFGGKRTLAPEIVQELGPHKAYWEPFCGSLAVLFAKEPCSHETVNDLNGNVVNLAMVVACPQRGPDLFQRLLHTTFCEHLFNRCRERLAQDEEVCPEDRAYCFFVESWMARNGVAGTRSANAAFCVRFTSNGGDPAMRFRNAVDSIPEWHKRLRNAWILNRNAFELIERIEDKAGTVIYADPPYIEKGASYLHDFADDDHVRLAELLARFRETRVVVSYYDHPQLDSLYPGFTKRPLKATKAMVNQGMRGSKGATAAPEVLLINGRSFVTGGGLFN
jgi:DNA adenine methylase